MSPKEYKELLATGVKPPKFIAHVLAFRTVHLNDDGTVNYELSGTGVNLPNRKGV